MTKRMTINLVLLTATILVISPVWTNSIFANNVIQVWTPAGNAVGYSHGVGTGMVYAFSNSDQAGLQYYITTNAKAWGPCSPDMSCPPYQWSVKATDNKETYWSTLVESNNLWHGYHGIKITRHGFMNSPGMMYVGFTTTEANNQHASHQCFYSGPGAPGCTYPTN